MKSVWASLPALALVACQSVPFVAPKVPVPTNWAPQTQAVAAGAPPPAPPVWPTGLGRRSFPYRN